MGMASSDVPSSTVCYRLDWRWGPSIENLETFTYADGWGHLDWDLSGHDVKPFNQRSSKPLVQPDFPCFNVPDWVDENLRPDDPSPPDGGNMEPGFQPYVNMLVRSLSILSDGKPEPVKRLLKDEQVAEWFIRFKKGVNT